MAIFIDIKYLSFFIIGTVAVRHNWFRKHSEVDGERGLQSGTGRDDHSISLAILSGGTNFFGSGS
jgi:hypothetical protein